MVQVGQTVKRLVNFSTDKPIGRPADKETLYGKVIYVHPKGRFYTVEFTLWDGSTIRSCYKEGGNDG